MAPSTGESIKEDYTTTQLLAEPNKPFVLPMVPRTPSMSNPSSPFMVPMLHPNNPSPTAEVLPDEKVISFSKSLHTSDLDLATNCDWQAAFPSDVQRPRIVPGVLLERINVAPALAACNEAVSKYPDIGRFSFELGRVLIAAKDYSAIGLQLHYTPGPCGPIDGGGSEGTRVASVAPR
jgi:hypothetical protein